MKSRPVALVAWGCAVTGALALSAQADPADGRYDDHEVRFDSEAEGISIAGTLSVPVGREPHPAVLMITGNGPHTRDQMISESPTFTQIADHLHEDHGRSIDAL